MSANPGAVRRPPVPPMKSRVPSWANLARGVAGDLQRQQEMGLKVAACLFNVEPRQRRVVGTGARDQNVVDRPGQLVEELPEPFEVGSVEGGDSGPELEADAVQPIWVARGEDHVGPLGAYSSGRFEPNAQAAADYDDGLAEEFRFALDGEGGGCAAHDSSDQQSNLRPTGSKDRSGPEA